MSSRTSTAATLLAFASWCPGSVLASAYQCKSDVLIFGSANKASQKGIAVDDSTLQWCASQIPDQWPNTGAAMTSIRLFKAWDKNWEPTDRERMWNGLVDYVTRNNAKVLLGAQIHCSEAEDLQSWEWTKALLRKLQPKHVMGLAIGNELELLKDKPSDQVPSGCVENVWEKGYYWQMFQRFVGEFDTLGFREVPITAVFTGAALYGGAGFLDNPGQRVQGLLRNATGAYGTRFVFTFNFYPYFDPGMFLDAGTSNQCQGALRNSKCWDRADCWMPSQVRVARDKMKGLTKRDDKLWVGETGWSTPFANSLKTQMKDCPAWSSEQTFKDFYSGFLQWDLDIYHGYRAPDHAFWFTMRDSINFGEGEHFGLIAKCDDPACKLKSANFEVAEYEAYFGKEAKQCGGDPLFNDWAHGGEEGCKNKCTLLDNCRYFTIWPHSHDNHHWCRLSSFCDTRVPTNQGHVVQTFKRTGVPPIDRPVPTPAGKPTPAGAPSPTDEDVTDGVSGLVPRGSLLALTALLSYSLA